MERAEVVRGLRIAWSVWWGIVCVLLIVLWVRSYWFREKVSAPAWTERGRTRYFVSARGQIIYRSQIDYYRLPFPFGPKRKMEHESIEYYVWDPEIGMIRGFEWNNGRLVLPYWFGTIVIASIAALPWIRWSRKFSLHTLLIATTLVAVILGLVVYATR